MLELHRTVLSNGGILTPNLNKKINEINNSRPLQSKPVKHKMETPKEKKTKTETDRIREEIEVLAQEFQPKKIDVMSFQIINFSPCDPLKKIKCVSMLGVQ